VCPVCVPAPPVDVNLMNACECTVSLLLIRLVGWEPDPDCPGDCDYPADSDDPDDNDLEDHW